MREIVPIACFLSACSFLLAACGGGDTGSGSAGTAGSTGTGGDGLGGSGGDTASGGTGTPTPTTPALGAWQVIFSDASSACKVPGQNVEIGEVTSDTKGMLYEDGSVGAIVSCIVADKGGAFQVEASLSVNGYALALSVDALAPSATWDKPATGSARYQSPATGVPFSSTACDFYFEPNTPQGVEPGTVWLAFACDEIAAASDNVCHLSLSHAVFEKCVTTPTQ